MKRLLIANRAEIAIRIHRAAEDLGLQTLGVFSAEDAQSLHASICHRAEALPKAGVSGYLDIEALLEVAVRHSCDALHPGIGFLSESPELSRACREEGVVFIGPSPEVLQRCADKLAARSLADSLGLPLVDATAGEASLSDVQSFWQRHGEPHGIVLKAVAGGGGRGIRHVRKADGLEAAFARCQSEARASFGHGGVFAERCIPHPRHIEIQIVADGTQARALGERECSLQRRHQKLLEMTPAPGLDDATRQQLFAAAANLAQHLGYQGVCTVEFLLDPEGRFYFLEINPRLQVEHGITELVTGLDLVQLQLRLAAGATLNELGFEGPVAARGMAVQARVLAESLDAQGRALPSSGRLTAFTPPSGPGIRVDTHGYAGYSIPLRFDPLLAKVMAHGPPDGPVWSRLLRALCEFQIEGVQTNLGFLRSVVQHPDLRAGQIDTQWLSGHMEELLQQEPPPSRFPTPSRAPKAAEVLPQEVDGIGVYAPMDGTLLEIEVELGQEVAEGQVLAIVSAMKMEHELRAPTSGVVKALFAKAADMVRSQQPVLSLDPGEGGGPGLAQEEGAGLDGLRDDLAELQRLRSQTLDANRPEAVARRHQRGGRTARENIEDLCDAGSFVEYGALALPAQRAERDPDALRKKAPADGIITGLATVNAADFPERSRCAVLSYDYTVMAGTQGYQGHRKTDRMLEVAKEAGYPVVFFTEGGGGRPNDTDLIHLMVSGLECASFRALASLSGAVPLVGINHGRCFAGNAALLGICDVVIATKASNIGMGGPAMIEGGGLGVFRPEDIGPTQRQAANGVVDVVVEGEAEAVEMARRYLSYFQGALSGGCSEDPRRLRHIVPENRLRIYDMRRVLQGLADVDSLLELRPEHAPGMLTALARIEGKPLGIVANNPAVLAGAIDTPGAWKASRFMRLCERFSLPLLFLCDTPGIMVGPDAEDTGTVRAAAELFIAAAALTIPFATIVVRKGYGLGAQAMAGGHFKAPRFLVSWPTGEFGPMGLEGAVKLGFRRQLEAIEDPEQRREAFQQMVALLYERGKAPNLASLFEIDDVIDPADSRRWVTAALF